MQTKDYLRIFKETGAFLEGHFLLSSGRHSPTYFQCAKVLQHPEYLSLFSKKLAYHFQDLDINAVISPAVGGIVLGTEVGRILNKKAIFAERENDKMTLRRGFEISAGEKILVAEDVITTGGSAKEVIDLVSELGGDVVGVGIIVDRSGGKIRLHENQVCIVELETVSYAPDQLPETLAVLPIENPGSRSK